MASSYTIAGQDIPSVPVIEGMNQEEFRASIVPAYRPVILKGLVENWALVNQGRNDPCAALTAISEIVPNHSIEIFSASSDIKGWFAYTDDFKGFNFDRQRTTLHEFAERLIAESSNVKPSALFSSAIPVRDGLWPLAKACPPPLIDFETEMLRSLWVGNRTRTAAHWDLPQNFACVIAGQRRFTLFPISAAKNLYIGPQEFTLSGQATSQVDFHHPDLEQFPKFTEALSEAQVAELEPGDVLYVPSLWIHHVETLDPIGIMMNFWWRDGPAHLVTPKLTLYHALLTLRDMPTHEKQAWRDLFDHYIFEMNGDPMAHLPEEAKGLFGKSTPQKLEQIRRMLIQSLR